MNPYLPNPVTTFTNFFHLWLMILETHLEQLVDVPSWPDRELLLKSVIQQVLRHYHYLDQTKSDLVGRNDAFLLLSAAPWLTTFERTFMWVGGGSVPSSLFPTLHRSVGGNGELSEEQVEKVRKLEAETMGWEKYLNEVLAMTHEESIVKWLDLIERIENGDVESAEEVNNAKRTVADRLRAVVSDADSLRDGTRRKLVDILNPIQAAKFLAEVAKRDLNVRSLGLEKDGISSDY